MAILLSKNWVRVASREYATNDDNCDDSYDNVGEGKDAK